MMCDLENSYSDENGLPSEECLRALQNVDVKECYLQDCPGTKIYTLSRYLFLQVTPPQLAPILCPFFVDLSPPPFLPGESPGSPVLVNGTNVAFL